MRNAAFKILLTVYIVASLFLLFYSYTQVDLSLTLSRASVWQSIQKQFQQIGYYQRPESTLLYLGVLLIFFSLYAVILRLIKRKLLTNYHIWTIVFVLTGILVFSYPAFSYDFFNYMFTAKTVIVYHQNPYTVIPLQFTGIEPWLSFMHWTHLPSAYTPLWIILTIPPYFFGFGYFLLIMWNIKLLVAACYIGTAWLTGKILGKIDSDNATFGVAIFALNPLIIIESLVSSHNDIFMMNLVLFSIYLYHQKHRLASWFFLSASVGAKLMTIFLIPAYFLKWNRMLSLLLMLVGFILVLTQREVLPWYWVWIVPFVALNPRKTDILILSTGMSLGLLLRYAPFIYFGNYNNPVPMLNNLGTVIPLFISSLVVFLRARRTIFIK